jgi:ligand-binding sensor domain-containing protein/two-component sensor histidine kinase
MARHSRQTMRILPALLHFCVTLADAVFARCHSDRSRMWRHALGIGALLALSPVDALAQRLPLKAYSTADGLVHNSVNRIVRDSLGFLWFCTAGGLSRFDGYSFTSFGVDQGLPHADVTDFLETRTGEYWVGTRAGLVRFDPTGLKRRAASSAGTSEQPSMFVPVALAGDARLVVAVTVLREGRDGAIWVGTTDGLFRLESDEGHPSLHPIAVGIPHDNVQQRIVDDLLEDRSETLWIATEDGLYRRWRDGTAARYGARDGLPGVFVQTLLEDHEGRLWAGTRDFGFFRFTAGDTHEPPVIDRRFTTPDLPSIWVSQLFETSQHRLWIATAKGLVEYVPAGDAQGRQFRAFGTRNGLTQDGIEAFGEDLGGSLWLGMSDTGVMKLANSGLTAYGERDGLRHVGAIFEDRAHQLCFRGSVLGDQRHSVFEGARLDLVNANEPEYHTRFGCFDGRRFDWFSLAWGPALQPQPGMSDADAVIGWVQEHVTLQARSGEWWVGTGQGLFRFPAADRFSALKSVNPIAVYTTHDGLAAWQVFRLFEDSHGNVWISTIDATTTNGLARWEPASERPRDLAGSPGLPSLKDELARAFCEDAAGNIWIGFNNALVRYADGAFALFTAADGLPPGAIKDIHLDRAGRLWLASARSGLFRVDGVERARPTFVRYTTAPGLSNDGLEVIVDGADGQMFIGGARGLDRLDATTGNVEHFSEADGLPVGRFVAGYRDSRGVLWFGTSSSLIRFEPAGDRPPVPPPIRITGLRIMDVPQSVSALGERHLSLPDLAFDQHPLQIDFSALSFTPGEVIRYQYRLDDDGGAWSAPSDQRSVTYASLSPGRHAFRVRAMNSDGILSTDTASVTFAVLRPPWLRWWFLTLEVFAFLALVYGFYRYRIGRVLELAAIRTRISTDLHDDIGANLTRIAILSEVARRTPGDASIAPTASIARIARESVSAMRDIVWAIDPKRESVADLIRRMRQHAEEIFTLRDISLRFDADAHGSARLSIDVRRDLLLMFKEVVNNAARHSQCSHVSIELRRDGSCLLLLVADDGVGFDTSTESQGQGLANLRRRTERLKGTCAVQSRPGAGTTVSVRVPF